MPFSYSQKDEINKMPVMNSNISLKLIFTDTQVKCEYARGWADDNPADTRIDDGSWYELDNLVINRPDSLKRQNAMCSKFKANRSCFSILH